jgi:hypothetical protein
MASKVTIQDISDAGFRESQFGTPDDWAVDETGYVARLIKRATVWAKGRFGSGYDNVAENSPTFEHLRSAELCWVSAKLWKARAAFIDSNAASSRDALSYADRRQYLETADKMDECADANMLLALAGNSPYIGTGASLVGVETGPFVRAPGGRLPS